MVERISLYRAPTTVCDADEIRAWLAERTEATVTVGERFLDQVGDAELAESFAAARVLSPYERATGSTMQGIIRYEERLLADPERGGGVLYDGQAVQEALNRRLPTSDVTLDTLHIAIMDRHLGTWGDHDGRWHKRVAVLGQPTLISVPGLAEAPAKPESYYQLKQRHALVSGDTPPREVLESAIEEDVIVPGDPRTTDALNGYALAAYHLLDTGEAFCDDPHCRLFDGHRHGDVIQAQFESPPFCERHRERYTPA